MKIWQTPIEQHIKWYNYLMITTRINLGMGGRLRLVNGYSRSGNVINQGEVTRLIENQEALDQSMNNYLQVGSK